MADKLLLRHGTKRQKGGMPPEEGAFLACHFWMVSTHLLSGRERKHARYLTGRLRFATTLAPRPGNTMVGPGVQSAPPQALSHIALVNAAHNVSQSKEPLRLRHSARSASDRSHQ